MIKVRYNLGRGENYMKWKIEYDDKSVIYLEPTEVSLIMHNCTLKNRRATAQKIYEGANKTVCSWILCKNIGIAPAMPTKTDDEILTYNPRQKPYWQHNGVDVDNKTYDRLYSLDHTIFISNETI